MRTIRGRLLVPHPSQHAFDVIEDGVITVDPQGRIASIGAADESTPGAPCPDRVWLPGFVDTHLHFPQLRVLGSATGPLLDWLAATVFPEEARYADGAYARQAADDFCDALIAQGTTCASVFSSSNAQATQILFEAFARRGLRGQIGLTLMDRGAPDAVLVPAAAALKQARTLAETWHGHDDDRLRFCVTPRFALSCSPELLHGAGELARELELPIQTHLSENQAEIAAVSETFPEAEDYFGVYESAGLATDAAIFAHCVHLPDAAWDRLIARNCAVSHCPDSNFFLGSGCMPLKRALDKGARVGLGTDVGAGRTFSLRRVAASAYDASLIVEGPMSAQALLWLACRGGANALGLGETVGQLAVGFDADLVCFEVPAHKAGAALFDALVFQHDAPGAHTVMVRGKVIS